MTERVEAQETCSCGASLRYISGSNIYAIDALEKWRRDHKHVEPERGVGGHGFAQVIQTEGADTWLDTPTCPWCGGADRHRRPVRSDLGRVCQSQWHTVAVETERKAAMATCFCGHGNGVHYITNPEREWRCSECQALETCPTCDSTQPWVHIIDCGNTWHRAEEMPS
jgi:hypothetical protein